MEDLNDPLQSVAESLEKGIDPLYAAVLEIKRSRGYYDAIKDELKEFKKDFISVKEHVTEGFNEMKLMFERLPCDTRKLEHKHLEERVDKVEERPVFNSKLHYVFCLTSAVVGGLFVSGVLTLGNMFNIMKEGLHVVT